MRAMTAFSSAPFPLGLHAVANVAVGLGSGCVSVGVRVAVAVGLPGDASVSVGGSVAVGGAAVSVGLGGGGVESVLVGVGVAVRVGVLEGVNVSDGVSDAAVVGIVAEGVKSPLLLDAVVPGVLVWPSVSWISSGCPSVGVTGRGRNAVGVLLAPASAGAESENATASRCAAGASGLIPARAPTSAGALQPARNRTGEIKPAISKNARQPVAGRVPDRDPEDVFMRGPIVRTLSVMDEIGGHSELVPTNRQSPTAGGWGRDSRRRADWQVSAASEILLQIIRAHHQRVWFGELT